MDPSSVKRRLTCILAADAVGYSKMMGQDEEGTIRVLSAHRAVIDGIIAYHQGRIVSTAGDSVLAEFSSAVESVRCAVEIQEALKTRNDSLEEHRKMYFRVGVNLGDVVVKNDDLLGDGVNVAARLETMAEPGGICISSSVYDQITGKLDLGFQDIGEQNLKNISRPIRVYRVSGAAPALRPGSSAPSKPTIAGAALHQRTPLHWAAGALAVLLVGAVGAWQGGWLRIGQTDVRAVASATTPAAAPFEAPIIAPVAAPVAAAVPTAPEAPARTAPRAEVAAATRAPVARSQSPAQPALQATAVTPAVAPVAVLVATPAPVIATEKAAPAPATGGNAARFDGVWDVNVTCPKHDDGANGYTVELQAQVRDGVLRGETGSEGSPGWLLLRGSIQPDGSALLQAKGLTGDPRFSVKNVRQGSPYAYQVAARFEATLGTGKRVQLRACSLTFVKR